MDILVLLLVFGAVGVIYFLALKKGLMPVNRSSCG